MTPTLIDAHTHVGTDLLFYLNGHYPYTQDWPMLVERGTRAGISHFVVFPMVSHCGLDLSALREGRISTAPSSVPYQFENLRLMKELERFTEHRHRAIPFWMLDPSRAPEAQTVALAALKDRFRCFGLKLQATIIQSFVSDLLGRGGVLLDLAEKEDWPLIIHTSVHPEDPWSQVKDILRVAKARPRIRFNLAHSCRFDREALDQVAELPNTWFDCSAHRIHCILAEQDHPAIAAQKHRFSSDYRNPAQVFADLAATYPGKLLWGSDAPFESYIDDAVQLRSSYEAEASLLKAVSPASREAAAHSNIMKFLGHETL